MAKKMDKALFDRMRSLGVRKSTARDVAQSVRNSGKKTARKAVADLSGAAAEIQDRIKGGPAKRKAAGKKAARTRKLKAQRRSAAAKKGARKRARA